MGTNPVEISLATTQIISLVFSDNLEAFWEFSTEVQLYLCSPCTVGSTLTGQYAFLKVIQLPEFRKKLKIKFCFECIKFKF